MHGTRAIHVHGRESEERYLAPKLFDVSADTTLQEVSENRGISIKIPLGTGIIGYVAQTGEPQNIPDAYEVRVFCFFLYL
jgi:dual 3',5'-cyclic-AMP and -GMP phosphodiesterase 11